MASGDTLLQFFPAANEPPAANFATFDTRNGRLVLDFDPTTDESAIFSGILPANYGGGGVTVEIEFAASSATSGTCRWQTAFERLQTGTLDIDADSFAAAQSAGGAANATNGVTTEVSIAHTDGAQMDSLAADERCRLKVTRDADGTTGTDDMTGDAELVSVTIKET
jgi:hypothetical protein